MFSTITPYIGGIYVKPPMLSFLPKVDISTIIVNKKRLYESFSTSGSIINQRKSLMKTLHIASFAIASLMLALLNPIAASALSPIPDTSKLVELEKIVVPSGGTKTISLPTLPSNAISVKVGLQTAGAWRSTKVSAYVGQNGTKKTVAEPTNDSRKLHQAILAVPANSTKTITFTSSRASVSIRSAVISYELAKAKAPIEGADNLVELEEVVVPSGGSKTISLTGLPSTAVAAKLIVQTSGAWRYTKLTALVGSNGTEKIVAEPTNDSKQTQTVTLVFPANSTKTITFKSSQASVKVKTAIVGFKDAPVVIPPVIVPKEPVVVAPPVVTPPVVVPEEPVVAPPVIVPEEPVVTPPVVTPEEPVSTIAGANNTGVPAGTKLTVYNGNLTISVAGTVIDSMDIRGKVNITAPNVTIKNSIIRGKSDTTLLVNNLGGHAGLKIIDSEIFASTESHNSQGIYGYNFTLTRVDIHNVIDGVHITGSNVTVEDSWIHDNLHYVNDPNFNGSPSHDDSIQIQVGNNIMITGNTLSGPYNANTQITQDRGVVSNVTFTENNFSGGKCSINIAEKSYGPLKGIVIKDNKFAQNTSLANCAVISKTTTIIDHADNFYTDGTTVSIRRG